MTNDNKQPEEKVLYYKNEDETQVEEGNKIDAVQSPLKHMQSQDGLNTSGMRTPD